MNANKNFQDLMKANRLLTADEEELKRRSISIQKTSTITALYLSDKIKKQQFLFQIPESLYGIVENRFPIPDDTVSVFLYHYICICIEQCFSLVIFLIDDL